MLRWHFLLLVAALAASPARLPAETEVSAHVAPTVERVRVALARAVKWLETHQNPSGRWGSPATNLSDIYAPPPGSQRAFDVASAALALIGLREAQEAGAAVQAEVIDRAQASLIKSYAVRRIRPDTLYNTWALGYGLEALAGEHRRESRPHRKRALADAMRGCVRGLERWSFADGGWGYYNFGAKTRSPSNGTTSFTTATILRALWLAKQEGVSFPKQRLDRAVESVRVCWRPSNAFFYGQDYRLGAGTIGVNKVKGSLARTPCCLHALELFGEPIPASRWQRAFDDLEHYGHFLRIARKYPIPHETWYQNSGYFCLYGYYYAALALDVLPAKQRRLHAGNIARHVVAMQEQDGSVWDYQLFHFHKTYGTGYACTILARALKHLQADPAPSK